MKIGSRAEGARENPLAPWLFLNFAAKCVCVCGVRAMLGKLDSTFRLRTTCKKLIKQSVEDFIKSAQKIFPVWFFPRPLLILLSLSSLSHLSSPIILWDAIEGAGAGGGGSGEEAVVFFPSSFFSLLSFSVLLYLFKYSFFSTSFYYISPLDPFFFFFFLCLS